MQLGIGCNLKFINYFWNFPCNILRPKQSVNGSCRKWHCAGRLLMALSVSLGIGTRILGNIVRAPSWSLRPWTLPSPPPSASFPAQQKQFAWEVWALGQDELFSSYLWPRFYWAQRSKERMEGKGDNIGECLWGALHCARLLGASFAASCLPFDFLCRWERGHLQPCKFLSLQDVSRGSVLPVTSCSTDQDEGLHLSKSPSLLPLPPLLPPLSEMSQLVRLWRPSRLVWWSLNS